MSRPFDYNKMLSAMPDFLAFNGRSMQYMKEPIRVKSVTACEYGW